MYSFATAPSQYYYFWVWGFHIPEAQTVKFPLHILKNDKHSVYEHFPELDPYSSSIAQHFFHTYISELDPNT